MKLVLCLSGVALFAHNATGFVFSRQSLVDRTNISSPGNHRFAAIRSQLEIAKLKQQSSTRSQKPKTKSSGPDIGFAAIRSQFERAKLKPQSSAPSQKSKTKSSGPDIGFAAIRSRLEKAKPKQQSSTPTQKPNSLPLATGVVLAAVAILVLSPDPPRENTVATKSPGAKKEKVVVAREFKAPVVTSSPRLTYKAIPKSSARNKSPIIVKRQVLEQQQLKNQQQQQEVFKIEAAGVEARRELISKQVAENKQLKQKIELAKLEETPSEVNLPKAQIQYKRFTDFDSVLKYPLPTLLIAVSIAANWVTSPPISPGLSSFKKGASDMLTLQNQNVSDLVPSVGNVIEDVPTSDKGVTMEENPGSDDE